MLLHIAAGNVDGLPAYSVAEGLLTGNINILKLPQADNGLSIEILRQLIAVEPALTDFIFMVDKTSNMFITGPQVIKTVTGENVTAEKLGGAMTHNTTSGVAHFVYPTEAETLAAIRKLVGYLPLNNMETAPVVETSDSVNRICDALNSVMPESSNTPYDMKQVLSLIHISPAPLSRASPDACSRAGRPV